jgi:hypothetical protein
VAGCAYFNGIYNARAAERAADRAARAGRDALATSKYAQAAVTAETVLVRHRKSRWRTEALYLAGRGAALSDQCDRALIHLDEYLALASVPARRRERAELARARCLVRKNRHSEARDVLATLVQSRDRDVASVAALWAARASIALGRNDEALRFLANADATQAQWELIRASMQRQEYQRAESLLALRARRGDYRDELLPLLTDLWAAGRPAAVASIVDDYGRARLAARSKASLHIFLADLLIDARRDSLARANLVRAQRLSADTALDREAASRLALLNLHDLPATVDVEAALQRARRAGAGGPVFQRLDASLELVKLLERWTDYTGASLFLAAEVARDSLRSPALAHALFVRLANTMSNSPLAPKALIAASALEPDSASAYRARVIERYRGTPFGRLLVGDERGSGQAPYERTDDLLRQAWKRATDSLRVIRDAAAASRASASASPP